MSLFPLVPAAIYACPFDDDPLDIQRSWDMQLGRCRRFIHTRPELYAAFERTDRQPASEGAGRRQIRRLLAEAERGRFEFLVVERLRRLATPPTKAAALVERFAAVGVRVLSAKPDDDGPLLAAALLSFGIGVRT